MKKYLIYFLLFCLVLVRFFTTKPPYKDGDLIKITSRILSAPTIYSDYQSIKIQGLKVYLPKNVGVDYGDIVTLQGIVDQDKLTKPQLLKTEVSKNILFVLRRKIIDFYNVSLPQPHSSLLAGIVLGAKSSLPSDFYQNLKNTGTSHVVVASGMNVTFCAIFILGVLLLFFPRRKAVVLSIIAIWLYIFLSCFDAPVVRAGIMASVVLIAQILGKVISTFRALVLSALVMLSINPAWISDLGFILSFVSTLCLVLFEKKLALKFKFMPKIIREDFSTSLAAQIGVAPILFVSFGQFNSVSPIINALVLFVVAPIMIIGAVGGILGLFVPVLGRLVLFLAYPLTWWFINVVNLAAKL